MPKISGARASTSPDVVSGTKQNGLGTTKSTDACWLVKAALRSHDAIGRHTAYWRSPSLPSRLRTTTVAKGSSVLARIALLPVAASYRRRRTSIQCGSSSTPQQTRPHFSAAISVDPEPRKGRAPRHHGPSDRSAHPVTWQSALWSDDLADFFARSTPMRRRRDRTTRSPRRRHRLPCGTLSTWGAVPFLKSGNSSCCDAYGMPGPASVFAETTRSSGIKPKVVAAP